MTPEERSKLQRRNEYRRSRARRAVNGSPAAAAAAAAAALSLRRNAADAASDGSDVEASRHAGTAASDLDELEAVMAAAADGDGEAAAAARGLWAREDVAAMMAAGVPAAGMGVGMGDSWGSDSDVSDGEGVDPAGGQYRADFTTGLAVSATLQRMKVWMDMDYANGAITVFAVEVARWLKRRRQAAEAAAASAATSAPNAGGAGGSGASGAGDSNGAGVGHMSAGVPVGGNAAEVAAAAAAGMGVSSARMMGRGAALGRGLPGVEAQQRNIRLGMMTGSGTPPPGGGPPAGAVGGPPAGGSAAGRSPSVNGMGPGSGAVSAGGLFQQHQAQSQQAGSIFGPGAAGTAAGGAGKTRQAAAHSSPRGAQRPSSASASDSAADSPEQAVALESLAARLPSPSRDSSSNASLNRPGVRRVRKAGVTVTPHTNGTSANGVNGNGANGHTNGSYTNGHASNGHTNGASHGGASAHLSINVPSQHAVEVSVAPGMPVKINPQGIPSPAAAPAAAATAST